MLYWFPLNGQTGFTMTETEQPIQGRGVSKVAFLFKGGREDRKCGDFPTEFFYGMPELEAMGWDIKVVSDHDLGLSSPPASLFWRIAGRLSHAVVGLSAWVLRELTRPMRLERLNKFDVLVATTNTFGLAIGALKRLGMLRSRVVFLAMGLVEERSPVLWKAFYRWALKDVEVYALAEADAQAMAILLERLVGTFHYGIDTVFWYPSKIQGASESFILSIGNDRHRDFDLLIRAWKPEYPLLRIVTKLPVAKHGDNVQVIHGDWYTQALSDTEIRSLYQNAKFVILPIKNTCQPSGQSACLQAMACGKAVVLSNIDGLWNHGRMVDGETVILTSPGDVYQLAEKVELLVENSALAARLGARARAVVEEHLSTNAMAKAMANILEGVDD